MEFYVNIMSKNTNIVKEILYKLKTDLHIRFRGELVDGRNKKFKAD